jgi:transcriptional regulator with XRE-family HTH domain
MKRGYYSVVISEFGEYLKKVRESKGIKITHLAEIANVSHAYLSQIESGKKNNPPSLDIIRRLAEGLNITSADLMKAAGYEDLIGVGQTTFDVDDNGITWRNLRVMTDEEMMEWEHSEVLPDTIRTLYTTIKDAIEEDIELGIGIDIRHLADGTVRELKNIITDYALKVSNHLNKELIDFIDRTDITYNKKPLTAEDRKSILITLEQLFRDRQ